jgi:hypothetical protein
LTTKDEDGGLGSEVSSRLDELFGDGDLDDAQKSTVSPKAKPVAAGTARKMRSEARFAETSHGKDSPIKNLQALVFSIDWEITDETMVAFLGEVSRLQQTFKNDQVLLLFLKLHESIGKYIKARKAKAHPDAIKFVASVYKHFEKVLSTPGMPELQKKKLLASQVNKFKEFKQRVLLREGAMAPSEKAVYEVAVEPSPVPRMAEKAAPGAGLSLESRQAIDYIVEELKKTIKSEFHTMRQIIKNLGA